MIRAADSPMVAKNSSLIAKLSALFLGILAALIFLLSPTTAFAHAQLVETAPEAEQKLSSPPKLLSLTFNETVSPLAESFKLYDSSANSYEFSVQSLGKVVNLSLEADLAPGNYLLNWRVVSADGHPIAGTLKFVVLNPDGSEPNETPAPNHHPNEPGENPEDFAITNSATDLFYNFANFFYYLGILGLAGIVFFQNLIKLLRPEEAKPSFDNQQKVTLFFGISAVLGSVLAVPLNALRILGLAPEKIFTFSSWTNAILDQYLVIALITTATVVILLIINRSKTQLQKVRSCIESGLAVVLVASPVIIGHTMLFQPTALIVVADLIHLLVAGFWFGGLISLILLLREFRVTQRLDSTSTAVEAAKVLKTFSSFAAASAVLLALSGLVMATMILPDFSSLFNTAYGRTLLVKIGLVAVVALIAFWNRIRLVPTIEKQPNRKIAWQKLTELIRYEAVILVAAIAFTAILVALSPNHTESEKAASSESENTVKEQTVVSDFGKGKLEAKLSPSLSGINQLKFRLLDQNSQPIQLAEAPTIKLYLSELNLGPILVEASPSASGTEWSADPEFAFPGNWRIELSARISKFEQPVTSFEVKIR